MFQSLEFWKFAIGASFLFWLIPVRFRPFSIVVAPLASIISTDNYFPSYLGVGLLSAAVYWLAPLTRGEGSWQKRLLATLVLIDLGILLSFKYLPPLLTSFQENMGLPNFVVPVGVSYFSLKLIHYSIEVSRGSLPQHTFGDFIIYMLLLPTFSAGPIERFDHFCENRTHLWSWELLLEGATRICHGLVKRFAIMEVILLPLHGELRSIGDLVNVLEELPFYRVWWFLILSYLSAYLDFSAYSDIAIGTSRLFGIRIMENFNFPIAAPNLSEFWRRWHMTLAGWCQRYVYMPTLGLTRNPYLAVYATFLTMGLWHDAAPQWVAWGIYHASGIVVQQKWSRWRKRKGRPSPVSRWAGCALTFLFVSAGYSFVTGYKQAPIIDSLRVLLRAFAISL